MAIIQVSKIQHRTGANVDLPQLAEGEVGFATDERKLYIGNDPLLHPPADGNTTTQTEILTEVSTLNFAKVDGSANTTLNIDNVQEGQVLAVQDGAWVNAGGPTSNTVVDLGKIENVKIYGGVNGYALQTDGQGNLQFVNSGVLSYEIAGISKTNPAVVTLTKASSIVTGVPLTIVGVEGDANILNAIATSGERGTSKYYAKVIDETTFELFRTDKFDVVADQVDFSSPSLGNITPYTGTATVSFFTAGAGTSAGANNQIQITDGAGIFVSSANLTFNRITNQLQVGGNITSTQRVIGNTVQASNTFIGRIGAISPNSGAFTSITATTSANIAGNLNIGGSIDTNGNIDANNLSINNISADGRVTARDLTLTGNVRSPLVPNVDIAYDLGSPTQRWKDIYLSGNTIYLGEQTISATPTGLSFSGSSFNANNLSVTSVNAASLSGSLTDSNQPNITNLGNLSSLTVEGPVNLGSAANLTLTGGSPNFVLTTRGNGTVAWEPTQIVKTLPSGPVNSIQFNDNGDLGGSSAIIFDKDTGVVTGTFSGNGSRLSSITGANITGQVSNSLVSGTVYTNAQPNITSVGELTGLSVNGNASFVNATLTGNISTFGSANFTGNLRAGNIGNVDSITAVSFTGNGANLASITGANVTGTVANANRATFSGTVLTNAQPNITSVGNLISLAVTGNVTVNSLSSNGNVIASGNMSADSINASGQLNVTGMLTAGSIIANTGIATAGDISGANISATANMSVASNLVATNITANSTIGVIGNITAGNVTSNGAIVSTGNLTSGNLNTTGQIVAVGNVSGNNVTITNRLTVGANANVGNLNTTGNIIAGGNLNVSNVSVTGGLTVASNIGVGNINVTGNVTASTFIGNLRGNISGNISLPGTDKSIVFSDAGLANGSNALTFDKTSNVLTVLGNANVGNLRASSTILSIGNITGANILTGGMVSASGNVIGANLKANEKLEVLGDSILSNVNAQSIIATGNVTGANLVTDGRADITGNLIAGMIVSNTHIYANSGNIIANRIVSTNDLVGGNVITSGDITSRDINAREISATGNITAAQKLTAFDIDISNNVAISKNIVANNITANTNLSVGNRGLFDNLQTNNQANIGGMLRVSGNANLANTTVAGFVSAANLMSSGFLDVTSNANVGNLRSAGQITAVGNIVGASLAITANANVGNLRAFNNIQTISLTATDVTVNSLHTTNRLLVTANAEVGGNLTVSQKSFLQDVQVDGNLTLNRKFTVLGNIESTANIITSGTSRASLIESTGEIFANSGRIVANGAQINADATVNRNLQAGNISTNGTLYVGGDSTLNNTVINGNLSAVANVTISGNLTVNGQTLFSNVTTMRIKDPIIEQGGNADGSPLTSDDNKDRGSLLHYYNAGSPVDAFMGWDDSNAEFSFGSNVSVTNEVVTFNSLGNVRASTLLGNLVGTSSNVTTSTVTGNITAGNISVNNALTVTGNANVGNIGTTRVLATDSITGQSITSNNTLVVAGNASAGNLSVSGIITSTGNLTAGNISTAGILNVTGNANTANLRVTGNANVTVTVNAGNVVSTGVVSATGNITTAANLTVTANADIGNINVTDQIIASGNLSAANISTAGRLTVSGISNVGVLNASGNIAATGNVSVSENLTVAKNANIGNLRLLGTVGSALLPSANVTYDLGSPTQRWKDIYLANSTIYIGNTVLSSTEDAFSVSGNISAGNNISVSNNISGANLTVTNNANLGSVGNIKISGGFDGYVLKTDGTGNLSWVVQRLPGGSNTFVQFNDDGNFSGSSSFTFDRSSNTLSATRIAGSLTTASQPNITGVGTLTTLNVSGNASAGNLNSSGKITASGEINTTDILTVSGAATVGRLTSQGNLNVTGNIAGGEGLTITGNASVGNLSTSGSITSGPASVTTLTASANANAANFNTTGNVQSNNITVSSNATVTGNATLGNLQVNGVTIVTGNITGGNFITTGTLTADDINVGNVNSGENITATGNIQGGNVTAVANVYAVNLDLTGSATIDANVSAANISVTGNVTTANLTATEKVNLGSVANLTITGGTDGYVLKTNGAGVLSWNVPDPASGSNTQVQFNTNNRLDASPFLTFDRSTGRLTATAFYGSGQGLTDLPAANIVGVVANAGNANLANTVIVAAQPNITSVGNLTSLQVNGAFTSKTDAFIEGNITLPQLANITIPGGTADYVLQTDGTGNLGWVALPEVTPGGLDTHVQFNDTDEFAGDANLTYNKATGLLRTTLIEANGINLTHLVGPNVVGEVPNANYSTWSLNANTANFARNILEANGNQPNITGVGVLNGLTINRQNALDVNGKITNYDILNIEGYHGARQGLYVSSDELGITIQTGKTQTGTGFYLFDSAMGIGFVNEQYLTMQIDSVGHLTPTMGDANSQSLGRPSGGVGAITTISGTPVGTIDFLTSYYVRHNSSAVGTPTSTVGTTSGSGTGAMIEVWTHQNLAPLTNQIYKVRVHSLGSGYVTNDTITIYGSQLGGTDGVNDLTVTITSTAEAYWRNLYVNDVNIKNRGSTGPGFWTLVGGSTGVYIVNSATGNKHLITMGTGIASGTSTSSAPRPLGA